MEPSEMLLDMEAAKARASLLAREALSKTQPQINGQVSDVIATPPPAQVPPEGRRSSVGKPKAEEEFRKTPQESVAAEKREEKEVTVRKSEENDVTMRKSEEKEKRPREEEEEPTEEQPEPKRPKVTADEVKPGRGVALGTIPNFVANYKIIKSTSTTLRKLYKALFNSAGKPQTRRDEILQWSGIPVDASTEDLFTALSTACSSTELSEIGKKFLGLSSGVGGKVTKQAWCEAVAEILANPQPEKINLTPSADSKRSNLKTGAGGYQAWCRDNREALKAKFPDLSHKDFLKVQSEAWKALSEEEKAKYLGPPSARKASPKKRGKPRRAKYEGEEEVDELPEEDDDDDDVQRDEEGEVSEEPQADEVTSSDVTQKDAAAPL